MNITALSGIRTRDPKNQAATVLHLRPYGTGIGNYVLTFYIYNLHVHPAHMCVVHREEIRHDACDDSYKHK